MGRRSSTVARVIAPAAHAPAGLPEPDSEVRRRDDESLAEFAYRRIEDLIVSMELRPGAWISEPEICRRLELGRTPVREALMRLAAERLLVQRPRRGMIVSEIDIPGHLMALETRRALELTLVKAAARRRSSQDIGRLREIVGEFQRLLGRGKPVPLMRIDRAFIGHLIECSKNPHLSAILPLYALSRRFWLAYRDRQTRFAGAQFTQFHISIGSAVIAGDERKAEKFATEFLDHVEAFAKYVAVAVL
ncbi:MAG TPA: GntR family transcriptional regulator [Stellaceae bacterium]|nr:GntR family transcriptional regulator [Stellaceae bacterium]